jgi:spore coat polysaccharide biosynthesis protein SpsF
MKDEFKTEQESFWAGDFGTEYIERNHGDKLLAWNLEFFAKSLRNTEKFKTCIEFGANIGMNLKALNLLYPYIEADAIEINTHAVKELAKVIPAENVHVKSILDFTPQHQYDLVLIKTVLIHINPDELPAVYEKLVASTARYLMVAEYYNPVPCAISYRGHIDRLFKRDFVGEILDRHPELQLIDYGFLYHRDPKFPQDFPQDDLNWFLMQKTKI